MASTMNVPLPWSGTQTGRPCPPANSTSRSRTRALSLMNSTSREPQSRSIASLTVREVVRGPGVSSQGSRRGSVMACSSALDLEAVGVIGRPEAPARADAIVADLDLEPGAREEGCVDARRALDVAHGDGAPERMAVGGGGGRAHDGPAEPDGLVAQRQGFRIVQDEVDEPAPERPASLGEQRIAADEGRGLVEPDGEAQPGLERRIVGRELAAPRPV